ncbi:dol-P-Glc:Glc(2)Man(9)GlcNAc(2)-PP-Dol alpha-1,2-glucosyltransferase [Amia ocellicauda]|uniref:dol-P-Glc:Glc(2)Man(9)GlcNAc(2)-PP-Dol alpha-1,2-glucosyltransferase n=1 Tax=Amia ocellicauda TaxID=2972642 RepID=UPI003464C58D
MERFEGYVFSAVCSTYFLVSCILFSHITREQREPYMDEIFHIPQAQRYCQGRFSEWDPMITTLPGLYLVSVGIIKPLVWLAGWTGKVVCSTGMLRFINLLFSSGNLYIIYLTVCKLHHKDKSSSASRRVLSALALSSFPVLYFFTFLYYTDAGSTFFTLFAYLMCLYGSHKASALLGVCAVMFRQTNVIWVAFCAGTVIAQKMDESWRAEQTKKKDDGSSAPHLGSVAGMTKLARFLVEYLLSPQHVKAVVSSMWPYITVVLGFVVFVLLNGGIVVGDRSSHEGCLNFPQLFYFLSFTLVFSIFHSFSYQKTVNFLRWLRKNPVFCLCLTALALFLVWRFSFVHKYLLADNRHYPFYVWKKIFQKHRLVPYLLVPGYVFTAWSFTDTLKSKSVFWNLMFCVCLAAATVPQKLLEFRYFILPYLIYRLNIPVPSAGRLLLELGLYTAVNAVTIYLFLNKTFHWPDSSDVQRFMW